MCCSLKFQRSIILLAPLYFLHQLTTNPRTLNHGEKIPENHKLLLQKQGTYQSQLHYVEGQFSQPTYIWQTELQPLAVKRVEQKVQEMGYF
uniref:Protein binding protein n=1 Tax=Rhizophora mucronata TaxID=61149 RepID=A0A2P2L976_RHIMU